MTNADKESTKEQSSADGDAQLSAKRVEQRAMYRLYNPYTGEHFYTADEQERDDVAAAGWRKESIGWVAPKTSSTPVYRLYNKYAWDHHYTPSADERDNLVKNGWIDEGIGWYSADEGSLFRAPVYRQYNPNAWVGTHNYTLSTSELNNLVKAGWRDEGVGYYGLDQSLMSELDFNDIKVTTTSKVYNGKAQTQTITSTNQKLDEDYIVEYANNKNVGTATITITGINGFYGEKVYTFKITQKTISQVKWGDLEFGYDGKAHVPTATAVGLCSGDSATITVTATGNHTDTGTYTATATAISNKNYKLASGLKTDFRIGTKIDFDNKNKVTVDLSDETYTGSAITKQVSLAGGLTEGKDYTVTYTNNTNVGTATLTIKGIGEYFGEKSYTFKINQRDISSAKVTLGTSLTYNGSAQTQTVLKVAIDLGESELVVPATSYVISDNEKTDAGSYSLKITGNGNFKGTVNKDFEIAKLDISNAAITLGTPLTYNGSEQTQSVESVKVGEVTVPVADYAVSNNKQTSAGTYKDTEALKVEPSATNNLTGQVTKEFSISQLDISGATVTLGESLTYNGSEQTQSVESVKVGEVTVPVADYAVSNNKQTDAGTYKDSDALKVDPIATGNLTGQATKEFSIAKLDITNADVTLGAVLTYNGSEQTQTVSKVVASGITLSTTDFTLSDNKQTNAGNHTLKVNAIGKNFTGECQVEFSIKQATPEAPTGLTASALTDQTLADVTLPTLPEGFDGTLAWKDTSAPTGTSEGTITAPVIYTPTDTNYKAVEAIVTVTVSQSFIVVYHGNGGTLDDGTTITYTQACAPETAGALTANKFSQDGKIFGFWMLGDENPVTINPTSTKTCVDVHKFVATEDGIITPTTKGATIHLWAYWLDENAGNYWMENANADNPGQTENINQGQESIDANKNNIVFWSGLYNNGTDTESHLYTIWQEDSVQTFVSRFVESRIIQVGEHDTDGSAVTFMATHALPTAKRMSFLYNAGGWIGTEMYQTMNASGGYVMTGLSGLKDAVKSVTKISTAGSWEKGWEEGATSNDAFWLLSHTEVFGVDGNTSVPTSYKIEGTQYDWFADKGVSANMNLTRAADNPAGYRIQRWWLRSTYLGSSTMFGGVGSGGNPDAGTTFYACSVVPAFCF